THEVIRVHGARENNLKDVNVELPKRRLTVFTGVSGSGKSSLVFGTIAAESQRLINETYSAFVQGFMPTLARPDVDVLDGLTTAISVDQERMGANARSTVGTVTDADAMPRLRLLRPGQADQEVQQERAPRPALQGADQDQGRGDQPDVLRPDPVDRALDARQGRRRDAAPHPRVRGAGGRVHDVPRVRRN